MLCSILIGIDGSKHREMTTSLGLHWAKEYSCRLAGLGIVDEPGISSGEAVPIGGSAFKEERDQIRIKRVTEQVNQWLETFSDRCKEAGVASTTVCKVGDPLAVLSIESQRHDLIMLGRQTHFRFDSDFAPDDVLPQLVRQSPRPVVVVPPKPIPGNTIIIAYDGSLQAARTTQAFLASGLGTNKIVHIVEVTDGVQSGANHDNRAVDFLNLHGISATVHVIGATGSVAATLVGVARELQAGLLVMGAYGRSTLYEFFLGSVTRTLLEESPVPLFLYH